MVNRNHLNHKYIHRKQSDLQIKEMLEVFFLNNFKDKELNKIKELDQ